MPKANKQQQQQQSCNLHVTFPFMYVRHIHAVLNESKDFR